jgi:SAM-dependent methyltransferase
MFSRARAKRRGDAVRIPPYFFSGTNEVDSLVERERTYHNERFAEETRHAQAKYYRAILDCETEYDRLLEVHSRGATVLDYGCGTGEIALRVAPAAGWVHGIDISDVAIDRANAEALALGIANASFEVADAHATPFPDRSFDLVFGSGIIHHLDTRRSLTEIHRILKPGGLAIFKEPLGGNPLFDLYRRLTPASRTPDEHPLTKDDMAIAESIFTSVELGFYGLTTLAATPFGEGCVGKAAFKVLRKVDDAIFALPGMCWNAWFALAQLRR